MQTQTTKALKKIIGPIFVLDFNRSGIFHYRFKYEINHMNCDSNLFDKRPLW